MSAFYEYFFAMRIRVHCWDRVPDKEAGDKEDDDDDDDDDAVVNDDKVLNEFASHDLRRSSFVAHRSFISLTPSAPLVTLNRPTTHLYVTNNDSPSTTSYIYIYMPVYIYIYIQLDARRDSTSQPHARVFSEHCSRENK